MGDFIREVGIAVGMAVGDCFSAEEVLEHVKHRIDSLLNELDDKKREIALLSGKDIGISLNKTSDQKRTTDDQNHSSDQRTMQDKFRNLHDEKLQAEKEIRDIHDVNQQMQSTIEELEQAKAEQEQQQKLLIEMSLSTKLRKKLHISPEYTDEQLMQDIIRMHNFSGQQERDNDELKQRNEELQQEIRNLRGNIAAMKSHIQNTETKHQQHIEKLHLEKHNIDAAHKTRYEQLRQDYIKVKAKLEEYVESWGKQMSQGASSDDRGRENLSSKWSPMRVAEAYKDLTNKYSVGDIVERQKLVESTKPDAVASEVSRYIYEITSHFFRELHDDIHGYLREILSNPLHFVYDKEEIKLAPQKSADTALASKTKKGQKGHEKREKDEDIILQTLDSYYKDYCEIETSVARELVIKRIISKCQEEEQGFLPILPRLLECQEMSQFLESLCELCWVMALIHPPMRFRHSGIGKRFDENRQIADIMSECNPKSADAVVKYYIFPVLTHAEYIYARGVVMVGHKEASDN